MGQLANEVRSALTEAIAQQGKHLEELALERKLKEEALDVTIPGEKHQLGHKHPITPDHGRGEGHLHRHGLHRGRGPGD